MSTTRTLAVILGSGLIATALAGCSVAGSQDDQIIQTTGPVAFYPMPNDGLSDALSGALRVTDECVLITTEAGERALPVFPGAEASWADDVLTVDGAAYADGDAIEVTGGEVPRGQTGPMTYIPADCRWDIAFFVSPLAFSKQ